MRPPQPDLHLRRHCRRFAGGTTPTATGWQRQQERLLAPGRLLRPAPHWLLRVTWRAAATTPRSVGLPSLDLTLYFCIIYVNRSVGLPSLDLTLYFCIIYVNRSVGLPSVNRSVGLPSLDLTLYFCIIYVNRSVGLPSCDITLYFCIIYVNNTFY